MIQRAICFQGTFVKVIILFEMEINVLLYYLGSTYCRLLSEARTPYTWIHKCQNHNRMDSVRIVEIP